jgi:hypothetical protein
LAVRSKPSASLLHQGDARDAIWLLDAPSGVLETSWWISPAAVEAEKFPAAAGFK